jgi:hypothetical protein
MTKSAYYAGGLLWTEDGPWASDTVTNYYSRARMRSGLGLAQPTGAWTKGFTYDGGHRLATVISPAGTFTYSHKGPGNLVTNLALPNSSRITNAFDSVGRPALGLNAEEPSLKCGRSSKVEAPTCRCRQVGATPRAWRGSGFGPRNLGFLQASRIRPSVFLPKASPGPRA